MAMVSELEYCVDYCKTTTTSNSGWDTYYPSIKYTSSSTTSNIWSCYNDDDTSGSITDWGVYGKGTGKSIIKIYQYAEARNWYYKWSEGEPVRVPPLSPQDRLKQIIQSRQTPLVIVRRKPMVSTEDIKEQRARETLRRILGEDNFRSYVRNGFTTVRAKSGLSYQIFPGHGITAVYRDGKMVERLCVVLRGNFPPTDSLIMRYLLILNDEKDFRSHAVSHSVRSLFKPEKAEPQQEPLTEIFRKLKVA